MKAVCAWLTDRLDQQLHVYQLKTLIKIVKVKKNKKYSVEKFLFETLLMLIDRDKSVKFSLAAQRIPLPWEWEIN